MVNKTFMAKKGLTENKYYLIDAKDKILGRVAAKAASILRGKNNPKFTPNIDTGGYVIVINAEKIKVSGKKITDKQYRKYTGFHSGLKFVPFGEMLAKRPKKTIELAVNRMISKNPMGYKIRRKLKVYTGDTHPHAAQKPETVTI